MPGSPRDGAIEDALSTLVRDGRPFSSTDLAKAAGSSRQAVHRHLERAVAAGLVTREANARATRYRPVERVAFEAELPVLGLAEDRLWQQARVRLPELALPEHAEAARIVGYAFTEMVNNAIDHSGSATVSVRVVVRAGVVAFTVRDAGTGIFEHVRSKLGLPDTLAALQEISKGKTTTAPDRHSGEGLFFTSKVADEFEVVANGLRWIVDNRRADQALGSAPPTPGTSVRFEVGLDVRETLDAVFARYTHDLVFDTTRTVVKLFAYGTTFVSRSEAKRLLQNLDRFNHVVLDFQGVETVGQGFADEVFRVWANAHPAIELRAENMVPPVAFMVDRARAKGA